MQLKKTLFSKSPFTTGLKTSCSVLALTACLAAGGAQAADKGSRNHARGQYDTVTATYVVVEGDDLVAISERFEIPVDALKEQNKLPSNEVKVGQKLVVSASTAGAAGGKKPNVVMLMTDDTGWTDFGVYLGGAALGHPTPNIDRVAKEGAMFTSWYGQASCTAGRASFMTGRIPIRSALSVVVVPGDPNGLKAETPTIAEFYQKNGYTTYFSGKWHLGDVEKFYPINHGFDEMKHFAAYYPGVYAYSDTAPNAHPWFPKFNAEYWDMYQKVVNLYEWEGVAGKPAGKGDNGTVITLENLADFDVRQTDSAIEYIKQHAKSDKPFFMDVNFMKMHQQFRASCLF